MRALVIASSLVVVVAVGLFVWPTLRGGQELGPGTGERPVPTAARLALFRLSQAIHVYWMEQKKLPDGLAALTQTSERNPEPYLDKVEKDPWGNDYDYRLEGNKRFQLRSRGEDGQPDTADDLWWPEK